MGVNEEIDKLRNEVSALKKEINRLCKILNNAGIKYDIEEENDNLNILNENITKEHIMLFYSLFKGRKDVYSKRSVRKDGKAAYYPVCDNFWKYGVCPRCEQKKVKCSECENKKWTPLTQTALYNHLMGFKENCSDVIGVYPMLEGDKCNFLVFDFDNHSEEVDTQWIEEVNIMRKICDDNGISIIVERSRSGKGAHIWMFFEKPVEALKARRFGDALITKGAETISLKNFRYYDRMIPAQDYLADGGLGNLIALPLQGQALKNGNSAFVNENWKPYKDQWEVLKNVKKISEKFIDEKIAQWSKLSETTVYRNDEKDKPWKASVTGISKDDVSGKVEITIANRLYINKDNLKPRLENRIRKLAAFSNREFYKNQAMGFSNNNIPRIIYCGEDIDNYIAIPRGCIEDLKNLLDGADIDYTITDERNEGKEIHVEFKGQLFDEQQKAVEVMLKYDYGILSAATAFGKTVVGAYLVAERKVNTLILVHNKEIMNNWTEDFEKFLNIDEPLPDYKTKTGRIKTRKSIIGKMYGGHNSVTGIIDVVMISSLGKPGEINSLVKNYGMVIMDECHHGGAHIAENVLKEVNAKYIYGMTATPKRNDGHEQRVYMQLGNIRYRFTAKDKALLQQIRHYVFPRFTRLAGVGKEWNINEAYKAVISSESRNKMIINDALDCVNIGRTPIIITRFKEHTELLNKMLEGKADNILILTGGKSNRERTALREKIKSVPENESLVIVATGQYIGEGFNYPRLDTMLLATPIAWAGSVEQYAGRLHRDYAGKSEVIIYDYVDCYVRVLEKMYHKRLRAYKNIGYEICTDMADKKQEVNSIFDFNNYIHVFQNDIQEAVSEIVISSPGLNKNKVNSFCELVNKITGKKIDITVVTLSPESYPASRIDITKKLIDCLVSIGINVVTCGKIYAHFAVIDKEIVWYGSMNLLSREKEDDSMLRVVNKEIAEEFYEMAAVINNIK